MAAPALLCRSAAPMSKEASIGHRVASVTGFSGGRKYKMFRCFLTRKHLNLYTLYTVCDHIITSPRLRSLASHGDRIRSVELLSETPLVTYLELSGS